MPTRYQVCSLRPETLIRRQVHRSANARQIKGVSGHGVELAVARVSKFQDPLRPMNTMMWRCPFPRVKQVTLSEFKVALAHFSCLHWGKAHVSKARKFPHKATIITPQLPYTIQGREAIQICVTVVTQPNHHTKSRLGLEGAPSSNISILVELEFAIPLRQKAARRRTL